MKNVPLKISTFALMMSSALAYPALAQAAEETKPPLTSGAPTTGGQKDNDLHQFSQAGHSAMMHIDEARLAIFDGEPKTAMRLMGSAKTLLTQADKDAHAVTPDDMGKPGTMNMLSPQMRSVPVDGQLAVADDFVMSPEKKVHVDKANESFKKGDHATGLEELRLGAIEVNYTRWWLPIAPAETHLDQAIKLANENKYYEANLALKAVQDSVTVTSISFSDLQTTMKNAKSAS